MKFRTRACSPGCRALGGSSWAKRPSTQNSFVRYLQGSKDTWTQERPPRKGLESSCEKECNAFRMSIRDTCLSYLGRSLIHRGSRSVYPKLPATEALSFISTELSICNDVQEKKPYNRSYSFRSQKKKKKKGRMRQGQDAFKVCPSYSWRVRVRVDRDKWRHDDQDMVRRGVIGGRDRGGASEKMRAKIVPVYGPSWTMLLNVTFRE